jgi:hypothetical protein
MIINGLWRGKRFTDDFTIAYIWELAVIVTDDTTSRQ